MGKGPEGRKPFDPTYLKRLGESVQPRDLDGMLQKNRLIAYTVYFGLPALATLLIISGRI